MNNAPEEDLYKKSLFKLPSVADLFYPEIELENPLNIQYVIREKIRIMPKYVSAYEELLSRNADDIDGLLKESRATLKWIVDGLTLDWGDIFVRYHYSSEGHLPCIYQYTDGRTPELDDQVNYEIAVERFDGKTGPPLALAELLEHIERVKNEIDHLAYQAKWYLKYGH